MKHKVKVTVLDEKLYLNYNSNTVQILFLVSVLVIMWMTSSFFTVTMSGMTFGIWDWTHWLKRTVTRILLLVVRKCRFARKHGMLFHVIFTLFTRRFYYERLDEKRKWNDYLLFRWYTSGNLQNRAS